MAERGAIAAELGNTADAVKLYDRFLSRYDQPMAQHEALVEAVRAEVKRLSNVSATRDASSP